MFKLLKLKELYRRKKNRWKLSRQWSKIWLQRTKAFSEWRR